MPPASDETVKEPMAAVQEEGKVVMDMTGAQEEIDATGTERIDGSAETSALPEAKDEAAEEPIAVQQEKQEASPDAVMQDSETMSLYKESAALMTGLDIALSQGLLDTGRATPVGKLMVCMAEQPGREVLEGVSELMQEGSTLLASMDPQTADDIYETGRQSPIGKLVTSIADKQEGELRACH